MTHYTHTRRISAWHNGKRHAKRPIPFFVFVFLLVSCSFFFFSFLFFFLFLVPFFFFSFLFFLLVAFCSCLFGLFIACTCKYILLYCLFGLFGLYALLRLYALLCLFDFRFSGFLLRMPGFYLGK